MTTIGADAIRNAHGHDTVRAEVLAEDEAAHEQEIQRRVKERESAQRAAEVDAQCRRDVEKNLRGSFERVTLAQERAREALHDATIAAEDLRDAELVFKSDRSRAIALGIEVPLYDSIDVQAARSDGHATRVLLNRARAAGLRR